MITKSRFSNLILTKLNSRIIIIKLEAEHWSKKFLILSFKRKRKRELNFTHWKKKRTRVECVQLLTNLEQLKKIKKETKGTYRTFQRFRNFETRNIPLQMIQTEFSIQTSIKLVTLSIVPLSNIRINNYAFEEDCPSLLFIPSFEINWSTADYASPRSSFVPLCDNENT